MEIKWKNCFPMRQLRPETWESLAIFQNTFLLAVSKRVLKAIFLDIIFKNVGIWGRYSLKQVNSLKILKFSNQIVFVLSLDLLFYLMYQNSYQRWDILRLNEYIGLWDKYRLNQGNTLYFFQNTNSVIFVVFISLLFDLFYQRGCQR